MKNKKIIIAGIGTGVGKTVTAAIISYVTGGDYWKPVESGVLLDSDTERVRELLPREKHTVYPSAYRLKAALSPHHAARLEGRRIEQERIHFPQTTKRIVIESAGGILVPLNEKQLTVDLFTQWDAHWIVVSKHYLGSINHTLLTMEYLERKNISLLGIIFNGKKDPDSEDAILRRFSYPLLGHLLPEKTINRTIIQRYAEKWQQKICSLL